jgi:hypothetical protein
MFLLLLCFNLMNLSTAYKKMTISRSENNQPAKRGGGINKRSWTISSGFLLQGVAMKDLLPGITLLVYYLERTLIYRYRLIEMRVENMGDFLYIKFK